jgi:phosphonate transport system ATP-binding protein
VASLDPRSTRQVLDLVRRVSREDGLTVLMSLHQVGLARQYADRVVGLAGGHLVFEGAPEALDDRALAAIYGALPEDSEEDDGHHDLVAVVAHA